MKKENPDDAPDLVIAGVCFILIIESEFIPFI